jgi:thiamine pyrophosphate-dependent acetolactate synthase large subunit-like protein
MTRYEALQPILAHLPNDDLALFTTGMISREAFNIRDRAENFYMIGSMGLLNALGLGLALQSPARTIWVIEGDGSALMSLGTLPLIATCQPRNLIHVVLDNEAYESTGGQPTISSTVDLAALAKAAGYPRVCSVRDPISLQKALQEAMAERALTFILAKVTGRAPQGLGRVSLTPEAIKQRFSKVLTQVQTASHNAVATPAAPCRSTGAPACGAPRRRSAQNY